MKAALKGLASVLLIGIALVTGTYLTVPTHSTDATHFDVLIVLGYPSDDDGKPSPEQRARVMEAVREFKAGRAEHLIMTGAAAHNRWVEAESMARTAEQEGVPTEDIVVEPRAGNTIENIYYSQQIMQDRGWTSAEVVSSPSHLPRAGLILQHYSFGWRTHAASWPDGYSMVRIAAIYVHEMQLTAKLRWFGFSWSQFLPAKP
jgi:uncharacterized SAM-binding protein YcdF (DUF218 family)